MKRTIFDLAIFWIIIYSVILALVALGLLLGSIS